MAKVLVEGYRPGKGDGGRWVGVTEKPSTVAQDTSSGRFTAAPKLPRGGSAIRTDSSKSKK